VPIPKRRRIQTNFNWDRARQCVWEDFISPQARFNDRQFERTFRVTRAIIEETYLIAANADPFFRDTFDVVKQWYLPPNFQLHQREYSYGTCLGRLDDW
jgi:hypothetical protein